MNVIEFVLAVVIGAVIMYFVCEAIKANEKGGEQ